MTPRTHRNQRTPPDGLKLHPARALFVLALLTCLATALAGQDRQPAKKDKAEPDGKPNDVVTRVAKDMQEAEQRLKKTDPGDVTRKIQRDIIDGLDELIKQNSKSDSGGAGKSSKSQSGGGQKQKSGSQPDAGNSKDGPQDQQQGFKKGNDGEDKDRHGKAKGGKDQGEGPHAKEKDQGKGEDDKESAGKDGGKENGKDDQKAKAKGSGKDSGADGGMAKVKPDKSDAKTNLTADTFRADWGHLPLTKRLEMDAYSRERFMRRYDEVLQQYYRAVAEQGQKKND